MQSLSGSLSASPVTGTAANHLYFLSNEYANMISLAFFFSKHFQLYFYFLGAFQP